MSLSRHHHLAATNHPHLLRLLSTLLTESLADNDDSAQHVCSIITESHLQAQS